MKPNRACEAALALCVLLAVGSPAGAAPFVLPDGRELTVVDFDRHVQPLLNKLGCNAGACHGSGRGHGGGFSLSLFSASPAADHDAVTRGSHGRRIDFVRPDGSLLLRKATGQLNHAGGTRLKPDSWEYRLLRRWIGDGATRRPGGGGVVRFDVTPAEHLFTEPATPVRLRAVAEFADGTREDVTPFTDFRTPEPEVMKVLPGGELRALKPGYAPVLAFYRDRVAPVRALVPWPAPPGFRFPDAEPVNVIDREVFAHLKRLNLPPAHRSDDAEFLRRVSIDVAGRLPTVDEVKGFVAGTDPDKRLKKIDELLNDSRHAALWATRFAQITRMRPEFVQLTGPKDPRWVQMWQEWFRARVRDNVPVDRIFRDVLLATSRDGRVPEAWVEQVRRLESADPFGSAYAERATLDQFWRRPDHGGGRYLEGVADTVAGAFLGVPLECAGCHHHPLDRWSQADRRAFGLVFGQVRLGASPEAKDAILKERQYRETAQREYLGQLLADPFAREMALEAHLGKARDKALAQSAAKLNLRTERLRWALRGELGRASLVEVYLAPFRPETEARVLGGPAVTFESDAREQLFRWMTAGDSPRLARVFVNRVWKHYFGKGLVEPEDVMVAGNPPTIPALLDALTRDFVAGGYDLRRLERTVLLSRTYQLSSVAVAGYDNDQWFPSRSRPFRPMFPVQIDTLADGLGGHASLFPELPAGRRFVEVAVTPPSVEMFAPGSDELERSEALDRLFGRTELVSRCREDGQWNPLHLYSKSFVELVAKSNRLKAVLADDRPPEKIAEELFLATLARPPRPEEMRLVLNHIGKDGGEGGESRARLWQEILWALINTKEFTTRR